LTTGSPNPVAEWDPNELRTLLAAFVDPEVDQGELASLAAISTRTLSKIESGAEPRPDKRRRENLQAIRVALEERGIEFIFPDHQTGEGVRRRR
jgi:cystathionine beta-lyase family protein involved in aluminum resistance